MLCGENRDISMCDLQKRVCMGRKEVSEEIGKVKIATRIMGWGYEEAKVDTE